MKKYVITLILVSAIWSCKKENQEVKTTEAEENKSTVENNSTTDSLNSTTQLNEETTTDSGLTLTDNTLSQPTAQVPVVVAQKGIQAATDGTYQFAYNLTVGKTYPLKVTTETKTSATDGKQTIKESSKSVQSKSFEVLEKRGENYVIKVTEKSRSERASFANGQSVSYNTAGAKPSDEQLAVNYDLAKIEERHPITIEMTPTGQVLSISGLDVIQQKVIAKMEPDFKKMLAQLPKGEGRPSDAEALKNFKDGIKAKYSQQAKIAELGQYLAAVHPKKPLKVGEKWSDSDSKSEGGNSISYTQNNELKSVENNQVTITSNGTINTKGSQSQNGMSMFSNSNQTSNGKVVFDQNTGWIKNVSMSVKDVTKETLQAQGQKQNRTITTTTTTTVN